MKLNKPLRYASERTREATRRLKRYAKTGSTEARQARADLKLLTQDELVERLSQATSERERQRIANEIARRLFE